MEERIDFKNKRGEKLSGTLHRPDKPVNRGVILGHCFTCSRHTRILIQLAQDLSEAGFMALRFDFSGNGQSEGDFSRSSYSRHIDEMKTAAAILTARDVTWLGLAGHSMGAAIALLAGAVMDQVKAVCTLAGRYTKLDPYRLLTDIQKKELDDTGRVAIESRGRALELGRDFFEDAARFDLSATIRGYAKPVLAVHGEQDDIIPASEAHRAEELNPRRVETAVIPGVDHMFLREEDRRRVSGLVTEWFSRRADRKMADA